MLINCSVTESRQVVFKAVTFKAPPPEPKQSVTFTAPPQPPKAPQPKQHPQVEKQHVNKLQRCSIAPIRVQGRYVQGSTAGAEAERYVQGTTASAQGSTAAAAGPESARH